MQIVSRQWWRVVLPWLAVIAIVSLGPSAVRANPTDADPTATYDSFSADVDDKPTADTQAAALGQARAIEKGLKAWEALGREKWGASVKVPAVGKVSLLLVRLRRAAQRLEQLREPCGPDLLLRCSEMESRLSHIGSEVKNANLANLPKLFQKLQKLCQKSEKLRQQADAARLKGKFADVEKRFYPIYDQMCEMSFWFPSSGERAESTAKFDELHSENETGLLNELKATTRERFEKEREELAPKYEVVVEQATAVATALKTAATADIDGKALSGPAALQALVVNWQAGGTASTRYQCFGQLSQTPPLVERDQAVADTFHTQLVAVLAGVVAADAERATASDAAKLYDAYLAALAEIAPRLESPLVLDELKAPLNALAAKDPALQKEVNGYRQATADVLRWRKRASMLVGKAQRAQTAGVLPTAPKLGAQSRVVAPQLIAELVAAGLGKVDTVALAMASGEDGRVRSSFVADSAVEFAAPPARGMADELAAALYATSAPPRTIEAATALAITRAGRYVEVSGTLKHVEVASIYQFYLSARGKEPGNYFVNAVPPPLRIKPTDYLDGHLRIYEIEPDWVRGEYVFLAVGDGAAK